MVIEQYPDQVVYVMGVDNKFDMTNGKVKFIYADGSEYIYNMTETRLIEAVQSIDFNKEGVYTVELRFEEFCCKYPIQVIDKTKL